MKRILLLGANGFIGSPLLTRLRLSEWQVVRGPRRAELDLTQASPATWDRLLLSTRPDVIINAAGRTVGTPQQLSAANLLLVSHLLTSLERLRLRPWLIHLGCAAEYGQLPWRAVAEDYACQPLSHYGVGKLAATRLLQDAFATGQARGVVLRVFAVLGAGQPAASLPGRAAALLRRAAAQGQREVSFTGLETRRDYLDVRDVARAAMMAVRLEGTDALPSLLNVGSGHAWRQRDVVEGLARLAGYTGAVCSEPVPRPPHQQADIRRFAAHGWEPRYTLDDALLDLWHHPPAPPGGLSSLRPPLHALAGVARKHPRSSL